MSEEDGYVSPSMMNDVRNAIAKNMADNGTEEKPGALQSLPTPNIEDVYDTYKHLLLPDTDVTMGNKFETLVKVEDDGSVSQVRFLGKRADKDNAADAVKVICDKLNELQTAGVLKGSLLPLSILDQLDDEVAVLSYVMLSADGVEYFDGGFEDVKVEDGGQVPKLEE